ncbi:MAG: Ca2+-transporting ATPase, partial [Planctomycetaceae bacterium]
MINLEATVWHTLDHDQTLSKLESNAPTGLSAENVRDRLEQFGPNELIDSETRGPLLILWEQFYNSMILLLAVAAVVSLMLGEHRDAIAIVCIIVLNAVLGFVQDYRAERALAALKKMSVPRVRVRRGGAVSETESTDLVPGDVVLLGAGNKVPADCRLLESSSLKTQEAALTGESDSIEKQTAALHDTDAVIGDRTNMVWMGTAVTYGHGTAIVVSTGMSTELGSIANSLRNVRPKPTPLQLRLGQLGRSLAVAAIAIVAVVFLMGLQRGEDPKLMLMTALSLAVAVVPEGLPAVATVALALGARRMFQRNALIRKLPAVETLGSVTVICSDKTGTLTQNRMTVTVLDVAGSRLELPQTANAETSGGQFSEDARAGIAENSALTLLLTTGCLCNDSELISGSDDGDGEETLGEPTEVALMVAAARADLRQPVMLRLFPRVGDVPFDSDRKRMTTIHRGSSHQPSESEATNLATVSRLLNLDETDAVAFTKGAVNSVLDVCSEAWDRDEVRTLDD